MIKKILSFLFFKSYEVSSAAEIKSGYNVGRYDSNSNPMSAYYKS